MLPLFLFVLSPFFLVEEIRVNKLKSIEDGM
jgi:hypothetical protein